MLVWKAGEEILQACAFLADTDGRCLVRRVSDIKEQEKSACQKPKIQSIDKHRSRAF
jgi:hypothetical protein